MAEKDLETRVSSLEKNFEVFVQEMRDFKDEMRDFKAEMRQQNEMRAAEIARVDAKIEQLREQREKDNAKHEADIKELNQKIEDKFDKLSNQFHTTSIATILGVGAIVWAIVSALK